MTLRSSDLRTLASAAPNAATLTVLAIDPSSTCTGYAVFAGGKLVDAGRLTPARTRDDANVRILAMLDALDDLCREHAELSHIVIEDTSGKVGRRHGGAGAGLAIHGKAVGAVWLHLLLRRHAPLTLVRENDWTRGTPKDTRKLRVARAHRGAYDPAQDKGGDVADAIGLGEWWLAEQRVAPGRHP